MHVTLFPGLLIKMKRRKLASFQHSGAISSSWHLLPLAQPLSKAEQKAKWNLHSLTYCDLSKLAPRYRSSQKRWAVWGKTASNMNKREMGFMETTVCRAVRRNICGWRFTEQIIRRYRLRSGTIPLFRISPHIKGKCCILKGHTQSQFSQYLPKLFFVHESHPYYTFLLPSLGARSVAASLAAHKSENKTCPKHLVVFARLFVWLITKDWQVASSLESDLLSHNNSMFPTPLNTSQFSLPCWSQTASVFFHFFSLQFLHICHELCWKLWITPSCCSVFERVDECFL